MSQPRPSSPPYRVVYSDRFRDSTRQLLARAATKGRLTEIARVVREINTRLEWIPLDFGDPLRDLVHLGIVEHIGTVPPLVVRYGVDEANHLIYVTVPFQLLPRSGLEAAPGS